MTWLKALATAVNQYLPIMILLAFSGGIMLGFSATRTVYRAQLAEAETRAQKAIADAAVAVSDALQSVRRAEDEADRIAARQLELETTARKMERERNDALKKLTLGRPCLGPDALRLLNAPVAADGLLLPAHSSGVIDALAGTATDTDVALWASHARSEYNACRGRIDAIRSAVEAMP